MLRTRLLAGLASASSVVALVGIGLATVPSNDSIATVADNPVTVMAAGDIAESGTSTQANATSTGDLIRAASPTAVVPLGDNAYNDGSATDYATKYDPTWGSFKAISHPTPGNHEYHATPPTGYLDYFGQSNVTNAQDGGVYYAWNVGNGWRAYSLNSNISMSASSAQVTWLKNDLAAHPNMHYLAYMHHPRYNSGTVHGENTSACPAWDALTAAGADIMLAGHDHSYERWAKMDCAGNASASGIREFKVGSGGNQLYPFGSQPATLQARNNTDYGVLKLVLHENSYDWSFIASGRGWNGSTSVDTANKGKVLDSGTAATNTTITTTSSPAPTSTTTSTAPSPSGGTTTSAPPVTSTTPPLHYANNPNGQYAALAALGYNLMDTGMSTSTVNGLPAGTKALVWTNEGDCPAATPSAAFTSFVDANATNPKVWGYYLADEPQSTAGSCVDAIKARADYIHSKNPNQKALVLLTDYPGTYAAYAPANSHLDLVALDPYPCRWDIGTSGGCDYTMVEKELAAAQADGIPLSKIVPMFQVFGDGSTWKAPSVTELQGILAEWQEYLPSPVIDMTYTWGLQPEWGHTDALSTRPDWQDVMKAYIDGLASNSGTSTPTATATVTQTVTDTASPSPAPTCIAHDHYHKNAKGKWVLFHYVPDGCTP